MLNHITISTCLVFYSLLFPHCHLIWWFTGSKTFNSIVQTTTATRKKKWAQKKITWWIKSKMMSIIFHRNCTLLWIFILPVLIFYVSNTESVVASVLGAEKIFPTSPFFSSHFLHLVLVSHFPSPYGSFSSSMDCFPCNIGLWTAMRTSFEYYAMCTLAHEKKRTKWVWVERVCKNQGGEKERGRERRE